MDIIIKIIQFFLCFTILVGIHELGHFLMARVFRIRVDKFYIFFDPWFSIFKFKRGDTEYGLGWLPLGGYVKMLDERQDEVPEALRDQAFNNKRVWQRFAIVAAGPAANFVFALFAFWLMFMMGVPSVKPIIGEVSPNSSAAHAGLVAGMEILAVDGQSTKDWEAVSYALVGKIGENMSIRRFVRFEAKGKLVPYIHGGAKVGVVVDVIGGDEQLGKDLAMHIAASKPKALNSEGVPALS